jgi:hypothetical protein
MQIDFSLGKTSASFKRSWLTGKSTITTSEGVYPVRSPWDPRTHFSVRPNRVSTARVAERDVVIEWTGPRLFRAFRPLTYRILVDGKEVATKTGR